MSWLFTPEQVEKTRQDCKTHREQSCQGIDLVAKALQDPKSIDEIQRSALLGRPTFEQDAGAFLKRLNGAARIGGFMRFKMNAGSLITFVHRSPEICMFTICDWRIPEGFNDDTDANAAVRKLYQEQLRLEREQDPLEQAREAVRDTPEKQARFLARSALHEYETAMEKGESTEPSDIRRKLNPQTPDWILRILLAKEDYGFVIFKTREAQQRPEIARAKWLKVFNNSIPRDDNFRGYRNAGDTVHLGNRIARFMFPAWVEICSTHLASELNPSSLRQSFKEIAAVLDKPFLLKDTFLVRTDDSIFPELDTQDLDLSSMWDEDDIGRPNTPPSSDAVVKLSPTDLPRFFLWAYDANWGPPSSKQAVGDTVEFAKATNPPTGNERHDLVEGQPQPGATGKGKNIEADCNCKGLFATNANTVEKDEDGYEGRVKVDISVLFSWFYYARLQGYDMKDLWRRAQSLPNQTWTCKPDDSDLSKPQALI